MFNGLRIQAVDAFIDRYVLSHTPRKCFQLEPVLWDFLVLTSGRAAVVLSTLDSARYCGFIIVGGESD